jgi:drug/metabolite transporter (DMT)-like permease
VFGRRFKRLDLPPAVAATGQLTASSVLLLPVALLVDRPWAIAVPGPDVMAAVLAMALLSTALAYLLFFRILAAAGAVNVMLVTLLIPPSAMALGALVLGERLGWSAFAGLALIAAGLALIDGRLPRRLVGATARR